MRITRCSIPEVVAIAPKVHGDNRGFFLEFFSERDFAKAGIATHYVQDNHSRSAKGVLRGLHYQLRHPQGKLIRVARGAIFDVAVDVRVGSPSFGKWVGTQLDDVSHQMLWIPTGFAHGFCVLSDVADVIYKVTDFYDADDEKGIAWNDPSLKITWPIKTPSLSARDAALQPLDPSSKNLPRYQS